MKLMKFPSVGFRSALSPGNDLSSHGELWTWGASYSHLAHDFPIFPTLSSGISTHLLSYALLSPCFLPAVDYRLVRYIDTETSINGRK